MKGIKSVSTLIAGSGMLLAMLFAACDDTDERAELSSESNLSAVPGAGGEYTLNVGAEGSWVISLSGTGSQWCNVDPLRGVDDGVVNVVIAPNDERTSRNTLLTLASGASRDTLRITQQATEENFTNVIAGRLEIPRLTGETDYKFIDHSVTYQNKTVHNYCMEYNLPKRHARWVAFKAYDVTAADNVSRTDAWGDDPQVPAEYRTTKTDYSGYDRGHLVASNDRRYSKEANEQTFYYSNMSPQLSGFNQKIWQKLEEDVKAWMQDATLRDTLYVVKGGTIADDQIIKLTGEHNNVAVPKYYYMAVLARKNNSYKAIAFWLEHKEYSQPYHLKSLTLTIDQLEEKTGIDFFPGLPDSVERTVEAVCDVNDWTWITE